MKNLLFNLKLITYKESELTQISGRTQANGLLVSAQIQKSADINSDDGFIAETDKDNGSESTQIPPKLE